MAIVIGGPNPIVGSPDNDLIIGTADREDIYGDSLGLRTPVTRLATT
jgi:hypothetical protein